MWPFDTDDECTCEVDEQVEIEVDDVTATLTKRLMEFTVRLEPGGETLTVYSDFSVFDTDMWYFTEKPDPSYYVQSSGDIRLTLNGNKTTFKTYDQPLSIVETNEIDIAVTVSYREITAGSATKVIDVTIDDYEYRDVDD